MNFLFLALIAATPLLEPANEAANFRTSGESHALRVCYAEGQGKLIVGGMSQHAGAEEYGCQMYTFDVGLRDDVLLSFDSAPTMVPIASRRLYARMSLL